ncbi:MAG TPA: tail fiber protein [Allosphingosinicella sp.]|nr:tail fiber protein [Allosphingosinicella sp.]
MAEPFLSEIRLMSFNFAPKGWALCNGQLLPINQNQALFALLGTTYGGNGQTTFALPDFRGRTPIHVGSGHTLGEKGGAQAHTLSQGEMPQHLHLVAATTANGTALNATGNFFSAMSNAYRSADNLLAIRSDTLTPAGGSQAHLNMQPFLTISFCIALQGIFPSQN